MIQTLNCTTDAGAPRPIHKCGNPMAKSHTRRGRIRWRCTRGSCNEAWAEARRRYEASEKGREARRSYEASEKGREARRLSRERRMADPIKRMLKNTNQRRHVHATRRLQEG